MVDEEARGLEIQQRSKDVQQASRQDYFIGSLGLILKIRSNRNRGEFAEYEPKTCKHPYLGVILLAVKLQIDHKDIKSETIVEGDDHKNAHLLQSSHLREYSNHSHHASCSQNRNDDHVDIVTTDIQR